MKKYIALLAACCAMPASAELVTLNYSGTMPATNVFFGSGSEVYLSQFQRDYINGIRLQQGFNPGSAYSFTFTYDTDSVAVGGKFPVTFSETTLEGGPSFADFTPYIFFQTGGTYKNMIVTLQKTEIFGPNAYDSFVYLHLADNDGDIINNVLPTVTDPSVYDRASITFDVRGRGSYRYLVDNQTVGVSVVDATPGAVPEPTSWAMMIAGFALLGGAMRRNSRAGAQAYRVSTAA